MTRTLLATIALALSLLPAAAQAQVPIGGFDSDNVEFVKNFARHFDSAGGRLHEGYFYITTERDLAIYDVRDPENPALTGTFSFPDRGTPVFTEEDPDTNGEILLVWNGGGLMVIDVRDKAAPKLLSTLEDDSDQHTVSCVLDCTWAYGSEGAIVDLRDPANPRLSERSWDRGADSFHDVTEVSPGIVLTSTEPMYLLDARRDPENPTPLAEARGPGFTHANLWPHQGIDDFALVGGEDVGPGCAESASATFQTWDTRGWQQSGTFTLVDQFAMSTGFFADGRAPDSTFCVHWFDPHPTYYNGGLVAIAWYEHGVRFLKIDGAGQIEEIGWYVPAGGQSSGVYWAGERVLYVADYLRGFDILRFTGDIPQGRGPTTTTVPSPPAVPGPSDPPASRDRRTFDELVKLPSARRCVRRIKVRPRSREVARVKVRINGRKARTRGKRTVTVRRVPRGRKFSLQVRVRTRSGDTTAGQRTYRGCRRKR